MHIKSFRRYYLQALVVLLTIVGAGRAQNADLVLYASEAQTRAGDWDVTADATAAGGKSLTHPSAGAAKVKRPSSDPAHYFEIKFNADANKSYRLWLRGKAQNNSPYNDSVFVQFSNAINSAGETVYGIGTNSGASVILENCLGCGLSGWGWQDNAWGIGVEPAMIYFGASGPQTIRVQTREDGLSIDQIVLSSDKYLFTSPGALKNDATILPANDGTPGNAKLKVMTWNIQRGAGTDDLINLDRIAATIVRHQPDVVLLNEVLKDHAPRLEALVEQKTGAVWYGYRVGRTTSRGLGNMILSKYPFVRKTSFDLSYSRFVAQATINVGNREINLFSTHLDSESSTKRKTQLNEALNFVNTFPGAKIVAGDFNDDPSSDVISKMKDLYIDVWRQAISDKTATAYPDNPVGSYTRTRRTRIDFIFLSRESTGVTVEGAQIPDVRDLANKGVKIKLGTLDDRGVRPSDHNLEVTTLGLN